MSYGCQIDASLFSSIKRNEKKRGSRLYLQWHYTRSYQFCYFVWNWDSLFNFTTTLLTIHILESTVWAQKMFYVSFGYYTWSNDINFQIFNHRCRFFYDNHYAHCFTSVSKKKTVLHCYGTASVNKWTALARKTTQHTTPEQFAGYRCLSSNYANDRVARQVQERAKK